MRATRDSRPLLSLANAYLGLTALFAVGACLVALRDQMTTLFADDWRMLDHYQSRSLLRYLFGSENGHRLPATLALFAVDHEWFGGRMRTLVLASIACTALSAGLFGWILRRQAGLDRALHRCVLGFGTFALFWAVSCNDLLRGIYHMSLQTLLLLMVALAALVGVDAQQVRASPRRIGLAVLAAFLATWSHGAGVAAWAALVAVAVVRRFPVRTVGGLVAAGAATTALYVATLPADPKNSFEASLAGVAHEPAALAGMALAFLGTAPARVAVGLGVGEPYPVQMQLDRWAAHARDLYRLSVAFGAVGLLAFALVATRRWRRPLPGPTLDSLVLGLMAFSVGAGVLVSFVRFPTESPLGVLHARFLLFSTLFWVGSVCAFVPRTSRAIARPLSALAVLGLPLVSVSMLPALHDARAYHAATRKHASKLDLSLLLGLRDDELARGVSLEDAETVYRVAARLEAERRWPFQGPRFGLRGSPFRERFAEAPPCVGRIDRGPRAIEAVGGAAAAGWLVRPQEAEPPAFVVLVDEGGVIRGLADFDSVPPYRAAGMPDDTFAWTGFVADFDPRERYTAYAILGDARRACPLLAP